MSNQAPLYNSRIVRVFLEYIRGSYPKINVDAVLKYAGMKKYQVEDPGVWFNQSQVDRFNEVLVQKTGNIDIAREAGRYSAAAMGMGALKQYVLSLLNTISIYMIIAKAYRALSFGASAQTKKIGPNAVEIVVTPKPGVDEKTYQCRNRIGIFESLAKLYTHEYAKIEHPTCYHRGDAACCYIVTWKPSTYVMLKRFRNYSLLGGILFASASFFLLPAVACLSIALTFAVATIAMSLVVEHFGSRRFSKAIECQGVAAEDLLEEIETRHSNAELVQEMGLTIATNSSVDELAANILAVIERRLDFARGMILLDDLKPGRLRYAAGFGFDETQAEKMRQVHFSLENDETVDIFRSVFIRQRPRLSDDIQKNTPNLSKTAKAFFKHLDVRCFICLPIVYEEKSIGVLYVDNIDVQRRPTQSEISLLTGAAAQTAISINNIRSFEKLQQSEAALKQLNDELEMRVAARTAELVASENDLRTLLKEKDVLLKEVHHRVKNSLQVVSSLLDMTRRRATNPETYDLLTEAHTKILTMALIHSQLYKSNRVNQINLGVHLRDLVRHLSQLYGQGKYIQPLLVCDGIYLPVTQAIPIAFVLNELISNAYKYAFEDGKEGRIETTITEAPESQKIYITVKDNGVGISEEIKVATTDSLGLKLVRNLVTKQLKGTLAIVRDQGTHIHIEIPVDRDASQVKK